MDRTSVKTKKKKKNIEKKHKGETRRERVRGRGGLEAKRGKAIGLADKMPD